VREAYRFFLPHFAEPMDLVVRPKGKHPLAKEGLKMQDVRSDLQEILRDYISRF
jgi:hypothetical protein